MKITEKQIAEFAENNDMIALFGDMFELPCGNVIHESEVEDMVKEEKIKAIRLLNDITNKRMGATRRRSAFGN